MFKSAGSETQRRGKVCGRDRVTVGRGGDYFSDFPGVDCIIIVGWRVVLIGSDEVPTGYACEVVGTKSVIDLAIDSWILSPSSSSRFAGRHVGALMEKSKFVEMVLLSVSVRRILSISNGTLSTFSSIGSL